MLAALFLWVLYYYCIVADIAGILPSISGFCTSIADTASIFGFYAARGYRPYAVQSGRELLITRTIHTM